MYLRWISQPKAMSSALDSQVSPKLNHPPRHSHTAENLSSTSRALETKKSHTRRAKEPSTLDMLIFILLEAAALADSLLSLIFARILAAFLCLWRNFSLSFLSATDILPRAAPGRRYSPAAPAYTELHLAHGRPIRGTRGVSQRRRSIIHPPLLSAAQADSLSYSRGWNTGSASNRGCHSPPWASLIASSIRARKTRNNFIVTLRYHNLNVTFSYGSLLMLVFFLFST